MVSKHLTFSKTNYSNVIYALFVGHWLRHGARHQTRENPAPQQKQIRRMQAGRLWNGWHGSGHQVQSALSDRQTWKQDNQESVWNADRLGKVKSTDFADQEVKVQEQADNMGHNRSPRGLRPLCGVHEHRSIFNLNNWGALCEAQRVVAFRRC